MTEERLPSEAEKGVMGLLVINELTMAALLKKTFTIAKIDEDGDESVGNLIFAPAAMLERMVGYWNEQVRLSYEDGKKQMGVPEGYICISKEGQEKLEKQSFDRGYKTAVEVLRNQGEAPKETPAGSQFPAIGRIELPPEKETISIEDAFQMGFELGSGVKVLGGGAKGDEAYHLRTTGKGWKEIGQALGLKQPLLAAKEWASRTNSPWPITDEMMRKEVEA